MEEKTQDALIAKAERTHRLSPEELVALLADAGAEEPLAAAADRVLFMVYMVAAAVAAEASSMQRTLLLRLARM